MKIKIAILLILVLAVILRIHNLGKIPFWEDELQTLYRSDRPVIETLKNVASRPIFPPLYYLATSLWVKIFGINELMLRFPSLIFSVASVFFIFKLGKDLYGANTGLCAALLLAVSPYSIYYAQEAKMYSMSWSLCIISFWLFYRLITQFRLDDSIGYVFVTVISWYTSYLGIVYSLVQGIILLILKKRSLLRRWFWIYFLIVILFVPWLGKSLGQAIHLEGFRWVPDTDNYFIQTVNHICDILLLRSATPKLWYIFNIYIITLIFLLVFIKLIKISRPKSLRALKNEDILLLVWFIFPFFLYYFIDMFWFRVFSIERYIGFIHIPLLLLVSKWIGKFKYTARLLIIVFLISYIAIGSLYPYYAKCRKMNDQDWAVVFGSIKQICPQKSAIITFLPVDCLAYYHNELPILNIHEINHSYREEFYESVFLVSKHDWEDYIALPKYVAFKEWDIGRLNVKWYKRIGD